MRTWNKTAVFLMATTMVSWMTGCSSTSPVLLQLPSEQAGTADVPLKVGIEKAHKPGDQRLSDISTCTGLGCYTFHARMPRRDEVDYFSRAIGDYLRDAKAFSYCYDQPFDRNDVDLVLSPRLNDVRLYNSGYGTFMAVWSSIPYIGLPPQILQLLGMPQQLYRAKYDLTVVVSTPTGREVARYSAAVFERDAVNMYKQPFGNYLWYDSVFQEAFFKAMNQVLVQMKADRSRLMQAASGHVTSGTAPRNGREPVSQSDFQQPTRRTPAATAPVGRTSGTSGRASGQDAAVPQRRGERSQPGRVARPDLHQPVGR